MKIRLEFALESNSRYYKANMYDEEFLVLEFETQRDYKVCLHGQNEELLSHINNYVTLLGDTPDNYKFIFVYTWFINDITPPFKDNCVKIGTIIPNGEDIIVI